MIRGRVKTVEQIDPDWFCCEPLIRALTMDGGTELELSDAVFSLTFRCKYCHRILTLPYRRIVGKPLRGCNLMPMIFVDLDEGKDGVR